MNTDIICFHGKIRQNINIFGSEKYHIWRYGDTTVIFEQMSLSKQCRPRSDAKNVCLIRVYTVCDSSTSFLDTPGLSGSVECASDC